MNKSFPDVFLVFTVILTVCVILSCAPAIPASPSVEQLPSGSTNPSTPMGSVPAPAQTQSRINITKFTDPVNDLFDKNGAPTRGEPYLDITEVQFSKLNDIYTVVITVNAPLPLQIEDPLIFLEWDLLIDSIPTQGWNAPWLFNETTPDYLARVSLYDKTQIKYGILNIKMDNYAMLSRHKYSDNTVELSFSADAIGKADSFRYIACVRKFGEKGLAAALQVADKAPNQGSYIYPGERP